MDRFICVMRSNLTVFVVDDEEPIRYAFEILLSDQGIAVRTFSSVEAFLQSYHDGWAGCLFVDVRMPNMSGVELYRELRRRNTALAIVLMTGHASTASLQEPLGGDIVVLKKPFSGEELKEVLRRECSQLVDRSDIIGRGS